MATTTNYSWTTPDNTAYVKDGASAIRTLGSSVDTTLFTALGGAYPGLRLVKKQTIGTGVSSVTVTNAFSATYDDYIIGISGGTNSADGSLRLTLGGITTGYYSILFYSTFNGGANPATASNTNTANYEWVGGASTNALHMDLLLKNPFNAKYTTGTANYLVASTTGQLGYTQIMNTNATSATAFTITPSTGTMTGGTIYVYGYGTS